MPLCDSHCHFFSSRFLEILTKDVPGLPADDRAAAVAARLGWERSGHSRGARGSLGRRARSSRRGSQRPHRQHSRRRGLGRRCRGAPPVALRRLLHVQSDGRRRRSRLAHALGEHALRAVALFPAMHRYRLDDEAVARVFEAARQRGAPCSCTAACCRSASGRSSGCRRRSICGSAIRWRSRALRCAFRRSPSSSRTSAPGCFREALMAADQCPNIYLDTSSSNSWMKYHPGLTLEATSSGRHWPSLDPDRLLFGTDSSFFPAGLAEARLRRSSGGARRDRLSTPTIGRRSSAAISSGCFRA